MIELVVISVVQSTPYYSLDLLKCVHINLGSFFHSPPFDYMKSAYDIQSWTWTFGVMEVNDLDI